MRIGIPLFLAAAMAVPSAISTVWASNRSEAEEAHREGIRLAKEGQTKDSLAQLERAVSLDPQYAEAWADLGNARLSQGDLANAIRALDEAVRIRPDLQVARYNLAYSLRKTKDFRRAAAEYKTYLVRDAQDADAEYGLAESLKALGENGAAADAYELYARIEKRPGQAKWIEKARNEAAALRQSAAASEAVPVEEAPVQKAQPVQKGESAQKAEPVQKTESVQKAQPAQKSGTGKTKTGSRPEAFQAGLTHLKQNDFDGALARLMAAVHDAPDDPLVLAALGSAYLGLRDGPKAEDAYRRALKSASKDAVPAIEFGIAESLRIQGEKKAALAQYDRVAGAEGVAPSLKKAAQERSAKLR